MPSISFPSSSKERLININIFTYLWHCVRARADYTRFGHSMRTYHDAMCENKERRLYWMLLHIEMEYACARLRPLPRIFGFIRMRYMLISDMRCADVFLLSKTTHLIMSHVDVTSSELREIHVCVDCDCDFTYAHTHTPTFVFSF